MRDNNRATPRQFIEPSFEVEEYNNSFVVGVRAKVNFLSLIGIHDNKITDMANPKAKIFAVLGATQTSGDRLFASDGEIYYDVSGHWYHQNVYHELRVAKDSWELINAPRRKVLTTLHQKAAKAALDRYLEETFGTESEEENEDELS